MATTSETNISATDLHSKLKTSASPVWEYFGFKADEDDKAKPTCKLCLKKVSASGGNTSNLQRHLRDHHPAKAQEVEKQIPKRQQPATPQGQPSISQAFSKMQKYERGGKQWQKLTNSITNCLAKDMMSLYTVEKSGFKQLLNDFDPKYDIHSRMYFSQRAIPKLYETKEGVLRQIQNIEFFSATSDMWSSQTMEPYMSYTIHFIDQDWKLQSRCLQTLHVPEDHTAKTLADGMKEVIGHWNLAPSKQVCLTTDSRANIVKAKCDLDWPWISCFGHNLHLAITKSMKDKPRISRAIGICKRIVNAFSQSWKRRRNLSKAQLELELPVKSLVSVSDFNETFNFKISS